MPLSATEQNELNRYEETLATGIIIDGSMTRSWVTLKLKESESRLTEALTHRIEELTAEVEQLRLQMQQPTKPSSFFFFDTLERIPSLSGTSIRDIYKYLTSLERTFKLRNYELQLPAENTEGWANYALLNLEATVQTWATTRWGVAPDISWETFRKAVMTDYIANTAIWDLNVEYINLSAGSCRGDIRRFNETFRELRLLLEFVGAEVDEQAAITDYKEKITRNERVALSFVQFLTVVTIIEKSTVSLAEAMKYCEGVDSPRTR